MIRAAWAIALLCAACTRQMPAPAEREYRAPPAPIRQIYHKAAASGRLMIDEAERALHRARGRLDWINGVPRDPGT